MYICIKCVVSIHFIVSIDTSLGLGCAALAREGGSRCAHSAVIHIKLQNSTANVTT
jgi:hypothetical protein